DLARCCQLIARCATAPTGLVERSAARPVAGTYALSPAWLARHPTRCAVTVSNSRQCRERRCHWSLCCCDRCLVVEQTERPHRGTSGHVGEVGVAGAQSINAADPAHHRYILLAAVLPGDRLPDDPGRGLEAPQQLAGVDVAGLELTGHYARKQEIAGRRQRR